jgi:hypothetical protein
MDGNSRSRKHRKVIASWMDAVIVDGGIERYDDLHVDQIDRRWRARDLWFDAGLESFEIAVALRDQKRLEVVVELAFSLKAYKRPRADFHTKRQLEAQFSHTPPSLYLARRGKEAWTESITPEASVLARGTRLQELDLAQLSVPSQGRRGFYLEFRSVETGEMSRSVFIGG